MRTEDGMDDLSIPCPPGSDDRSYRTGALCLMNGRGDILYRTDSFAQMTRGCTVSVPPASISLVEHIRSRAGQPFGSGPVRERYSATDASGRTRVIACDFHPVPKRDSADGHVLVHIRDEDGLDRSMQDILSAARYQDVLGKITSLAVQGGRIQDIAAYAAEETAKALGVEFCKILIPGDSDDMLHLLAGVGWNPGLVGTYVQEGGDFSQAGFAIKERKPVVVRDLEHETRFLSSKLLSDHCVRSGVSVPMRFQDQILGVMGAHTRSLRTFTEREITFLGTVANTVATILERWKREETQLSLYKRLFAQVQDGILLTDREGIILEWNPAMERMSGYSREEAIGKTPRLLSSGRQNDEFYRGLWEKIRSGEPFSGRFINRRKDRSEFLVWESISPVVDPDRTIHYFLAILTDLSERETLLEALRLTEQIRLVGQLAGGILHEIRNPLIGIGSLASHLSGSDALEPDIRRQVRLIADEACRIDEMLGAHLSHAKPRTFEFQEVDPVELLRDVHSLLQETFRKAKIRLTLETSDGIPPIVGARGPLQQVFLNLFMNAVDAMPEGGQIQVELRPASFRNVDGLEVVVTDSGIGLPEHVLKRVNEAFFTYGKAKGVGLGLSICRDILDRHEGNLQIRSRPGRGAEVTVFLPVR
jgi:PAS domain S-box-containing protein